MSTQTITRGKLFISLLILGILAQARADWNVDFSRRQQKTVNQDLREPASSDQPILVEPQKPGFFESLMTTWAHLIEGILHTAR